MKLEEWIDDFIHLVWEIYRYEKIDFKWKDWSIMVKKCLLKKFGILEVNEYVPYREHPNSNMAYVFFDNDWHTVEKDDIEIITQ